MTDKWKYTPFISSLPDNASSYQIVRASKDFFKTGLAIGPNNFIMALASNFRSEVNRNNEEIPDEYGLFLVRLILLFDRELKTEQFYQDWLQVSVFNTYFLAAPNNFITTLTESYQKAHKMAIQLGARHTMPSLKQGRLWPQHFLSLSREDGFQ